MFKQCYKFSECHISPRVWPWGVKDAIRSGVYRLCYKDSEAFNKVHIAVFQEGYTLNSIMLDPVTMEHELFFLSNPPAPNTYPTAKFAHPINPVFHNGSFILGGRNYSNSTGLAKFNIETKEEEQFKVYSDINSDNFMLFSLAYLSGFIYVTRGYNCSTMYKIDADTLDTVQTYDLGSTPFNIPPTTPTSFTYKVSKGLDGFLYLWSEDSASVKVLKLDPKDDCAVIGVWCGDDYLTADTASARFEIGFTSQNRFVLIAPEAGLAIQVDSQSMETIKVQTINLQAMLQPYSPNLHYKSRAAVTSHGDVIIPLRHGVLAVSNKGLSSESKFIQGYNFNFYPEDLESDLLTAGDMCYFTTVNTSNEENTVRCLDLLAMSLSDNVFKASTVRSEVDDLDQGFSIVAPMYKY